MKVGWALPTVENHSRPNGGQCPPYTAVPVVGLSVSTLLAGRFVQPVDIRLIDWASLACTAPIAPVQTAPNARLKARIRPSVGTAHVAVFDRVVVNVVHVALVVRSITDGVFPKPSLPPSAFTMLVLGLAKRRNRFVSSFTQPRKRDLDHAHALGIVSVAGW